MVDSKRVARLIVAVLAMTAGCDQADQGVGHSMGPTGRDSVGVRIVENGDAPTPAWRLGTDPVFTVGWDEGDPLFTWPQSGRILPDGGALIGEFGEGTLYRLGPDGTVVETWGGKGEGPGEYQALDAILLEADSLLVTDRRPRRLTILGPDGEVRTQALPGAPFHQASSLWPDDRLRLIPGGGYGGVDEVRPEWVFESRPILAIDRMESRVDTLAELPHLRRWYGTRGGSPCPVQAGEGRGLRGQLRLGAVGSAGGAMVRHRGRPGPDRSLGGGACAALVGFRGPDAAAVRLRLPGCWKGRGLREEAARAARRGPGPIRRTSSVLE